MSPRRQAGAGEQSQPSSTRDDAIAPGPSDWTSRRWTPLKKFRILEAVRSGALAEADLWDKLRISAAEFSSWQRRFDEFGYAGLKTTRLQYLRRRCGRSS
jgi:hypothetical protein